MTKYPEVTRYLEILHGRGQDALQANGPVDTVASVAPEMWQLEEHHQHDEDYVVTDGDCHNGTFLPGTVLQVADVSSLILSLVSTSNALHRAEWCHYTRTSRAGPPRLYHSLRDMDARAFAFS